MPSFSHEALVDLFRNAPDLAVTLLEHAPRRVPLPRGPLTICDATLSDLEPVEARADLVFRPEEGPVCIVEAQLNIDLEKLYRWPQYAVVARVRHRRPVILLVVCLQERVARWARRPIALGAPGCRFTPVVVGPSDIPHVTDLGTARAWPELAVLSALAHGKAADAFEIGRAAVYAAANLDERRTALYTDIVLSALNAGARSALEALMIEPYEWQSDFARKYVGIGVEQGITIGIEKGIERGIEKGIEQGLESGREQGHHLGRLDTLVLALTRVLQARGVPLPADASAQLRALGDLALEEALVRAVHAPTFDAVVRPAP